MSSFFDILNDFMNSSEEDVKKTIDEVNNYDVTTDEGYGEYMKFLGDLRVKAAKYDGVFKVILGESGTELIDRIANEATAQYEEAKKKREEEARIEALKKAELEEKRKEAERIENEIRQKKEDLIKRNKEFINKKMHQTAEPEDGCKKFDISDDHCEKHTAKVGNMPSDNVDDDAYQSICNVVDRYMENFIAPYNTDYDACAEIEAELIEFACWLKNQK